MQITDYGNSYIIWTSIANPNDNRVPGHMPYDNTVRILLDSRCWVSNAETGETTKYNLISPCRTEWMYRDDILWQQPNYEFSGIFSDTETLDGHIRSGDRLEFGGDWREAQSIEGRYKRYEFAIRDYPRVRKLESDAETIAATMALQSIVARTEISSADEKLRATIEYPIRTMNLALGQGRVQVDTGPLIYPDLGADVSREIERLHWAFVCHNRDDVAEFVLRGPAPVMADGAEVGTHIDYCDVRRVAMKNSFYAAEL